MFIRRKNNLTPIRLQTTSRNDQSVQSFNSSDKEVSFMENGNNTTHVNNTAHVNVINFMFFIYLVIVT